MKIKSLLLLTVLAMTASCEKTFVEPHPLTPFIGKWVPYEIILNGQSNIGPFSFNGIFGAYDDSFEIRDTNGFYYPATYYEDQFNPTTGKQGIIRFNPLTREVSFFEENYMWIDGKVEKMDSKELWISDERTNVNVSSYLIKLKKL